MPAATPIPMDLSIPFDAVDGDRVYGAGDVAAWFAAVVTDGVHPNPGTSLMVQAGDGWNALVSPGRGAVQGRLGALANAASLPLTPPTGPLDRVDAIVLRCDLVGRRLCLAVLEGAPASIPAPPAPQRDAEAWELCLAHVRVPYNAASAGQAQITDTRQDASLCGVMHSLIEVDAAGLFAQYNAAWTDWFTDRQSAFAAWLSALQDLLDENEEAALAQEVLSIQSDLAGKLDVSDTLVLDGGAV